MIGCSDAALTIAEGRHDDTLDQSFVGANSTLVDFTFDGEVWSDKAPEDAIKTQLLYSVGQLNGESSGPRLGSVALSNITADGQHIRYHAVLPVAWSGGAAPSTYTLQLPRDTTDAALDTFASAHAGTCGGGGTRHDYWYVYRPKQDGCALGDDSVQLTATVTRSPENSSGTTYPEYNRIWEDGTLDVIALFSRYSDGATSNRDQGIRQYNRFVASMREALTPYLVTTDPLLVSNTPGASTPAVDFSATMRDGRRVAVHVRLTGYRLAQDGAAFDSWYDARSERADVIIYSGHSGLGENIGLLAEKGRFAAGHYTLFMLAGCDTFSYASRRLAERRAIVNPDDPSGTKNMEIIQSAMPIPFSRLSPDAMALFTDVFTGQSPSYAQILSRFQAAQVMVVTGDEDNLWRP